MRHFYSLSWGVLVSLFSFWNLVNISTPETSPEISIHHSSAKENQNVSTGQAEMCTHPDYNALVALYNSTNGPNWTNNTGWVEGVAGTNCDPCTWYGIGCDGNGRVTCIDLDGAPDPCIVAAHGGGNNLSGTLPDLDLPFLEILSLGWNNLSGNLPDFQMTPNLLTLHLWNNNFSGSIPDFSGVPNIEILVLGWNNFTGAVPNFSSIPNLRELNLSINSTLGNGIPDFTNLPNLENLFFRQSNQSGTFPTFTNLPNLIWLSAWGNSYTGNLPTILSQHPNLENLLLYDNSFSGNIPADYGSLTALINMQLQNNDLNGCIPSALQSLCGQLTTADISNNPLLDNDSWTTFCNSQNGMCACTHPDYDALIALYNSTNGPNWTNNTGWVEGVAGTNCDPCTWYGIQCDGNGRVTCIDLDGEVDCDNLGIIPPGNNLSGTLPSLFDNLPFLTGLFLSQNNISGSIPNFSNTPSLEQFNIDNNNLSGSIPDFSNLPNLVRLRCDHNQLSGSIPDFTNLSNLEFFDCGPNDLNGSIPDFSNVPNLEFFFCDRNNISGTIPDFANLLSLRRFGCDENNLSGSIPNFTNLATLEFFNCNQNTLSGSIPDFSNLPNLRDFYCNSNNLIGSIPDFSNLSGLVSLLLNSNNLIGEIPDFNNSPNLAFLECNSNNLTGSIPDFLSLLNLERVEFNNNDLSGCYPNFVCTITTFDASNNPFLPWQGDATNFCNGDPQIGAPCDDRNAATIGETIQPDCDCALVAACPTGTTVTVTNTNDSGDGSLREAINCANADPLLDIIEFNINGTPPFVISLASPLPNITDDGIALNVNTQPGWVIGDIAIDGQGNVITGLTVDGNTFSTNGLYIHSCWNTQLTVNGLNASIDNSVFSGVNTSGVEVRLQGDGATFINSKVGTTPDGLADFDPNLGNMGLRIEASNVTVDNSVFSGNSSGTSSGITVAFNDPNQYDNITITNNKVGTDINGQFAIPNSSGISLLGPTNSIIANNIVSGNNGDGISLAGCVGGIIENNEVGVSGTIDIPNGGEGIAIRGVTNFGGTTDLTIGPDNIVANNDRGVTIGVDCERNLITQNQIFCNANEGIWLFNVGNQNKPSPAIITATTAAISGTAGPNETIEVFVSSYDNCTTTTCQGSTLIGTTTSNAAGAWTLSSSNFVSNPNPGDDITATTTDTNNNTSEFATCATLLNACMDYNATVSISNPNVCIGDEYDWILNFSAGGNPPFTVNYTINGTPQTVSNVTDGFTITLTADAITTFDLTSVVDVEQCDATSLDPPITLTPNALPVANTPPPYAECEMSGGQAIFDLTSLHSFINNNTGNAVDWYEDIDLNNPIATPDDYFSIGGIVYATVSDAFCTSEPVPVELVMNPAPIFDLLNLPTTACVGEEINVSVDLSDNGGTPPYSGTVTLTDQNFNPVEVYTYSDATGVLDFSFSIDQPGIYEYATLGLSDANGCFPTTVPQVIFSIEVLPLPEAFPAGPLTACNIGGNSGVFDLTQLDLLITGGNGNAVNWYEDPSLTQPITSPENYISGHTSVFAQVTDGFCFSAPVLVDLFIEDVITPVFSFPTDYENTDGLVSLPTTSDNGISGSWSGSIIDCCNQFDPATTGPGAFVLTFTPDGDECGTPIQVTVNITQVVAPFSVAAFALPPSCEEGATTYEANGAIDVEVTNPSICNDGIYNIEIIPVANSSPLGNTPPVPTPSTQFDVPAGLYVFLAAGAGDYDVVVTEVGPCDVDPNPVITTISIPDGAAAVTPNLTPVGPFCENGEVIALPDVQSGISGSWSGPGISCCNEFDPASLGAGNYDLVFTPDAGQCANAASINIVVEPAPTMGQSASLDACDEGGGIATFDLTSLDAQITGGGGNTVLWFTDPAGNFPIVQPTAYVSGSALVYAQVSNGLCFSQAVPITLTVQPSTTIILNPVGPFCEADAPVELVSIQSGVSGTWSGFGIDCCNTFDPIISGPGSWTLTFTPNDGQCALPATTMVTVQAAANPIFDLPTEICDSEPEFTLPFFSNNGISGSWNIGTTFNPILYSGTSVDLTFTPGPNECALTYETSINVLPSPIIVSIDASNPSDCGQTDGQININDVTGNNLEYSINGGQSWQFSPLFTGLGAGTYDVVVREVANMDCIATEQVTLIAPSAPIILGVNANPPSDCGLTDGSIAINAQGIFLEYSINGGQSFQTDPNFCCLGAGAYDIVVREIDSPSCTAVSSVNIAAPQTPEIITINTIDPSDCFETDGAIEVAASGTLLEYSLDGQNFQTQSNFTDLPQGDYTVYVREVNAISCVVSAMVSLNDPLPPVITDVVLVNPFDCGSGESGSIEIFVENPTPSTRYSIDGGQSFFEDNLFPSLASGDYDVVVREAETMDCIVTVSVSLTALDAFEAVCMLTSSASQAGASDGEISVTISGGAPPYTINWAGPVSGMQTVDAPGTYAIPDLPEGDYMITSTDNTVCPDQICDITVDSNGGGNGDVAINISDAAGDTGDPICVEVTVENFIDIIGLQFSINYDPALLEFVSVGNFGLPGLNENVMGLPNGNGTQAGDITVSWFDNSLVGIDLPDGTVLFEVCFTILGDNTTTEVEISDTPSFIQVININNVNLPVTTTSGVVTIGNGGITCTHPDYNALMAFYEATNGAEWTNNDGWAEGLEGTNCDPCTWFGIQCDGNDRVICIELDDPIDINCSPLGFSTFGNNLTGNLPIEMAELTFLQHLNLIGNNIGEAIPDIFGEMDDFNALLLQGNSFVSPLPPSLFTRPDLEHLNLRGNDFEQELPTEFCNLTSLRRVVLSGNEFFGDIPDCITTFSNLGLLYLGSNEFTGEIPANIGDLSNLVFLDLSNNNLTGEIPASLGNLVPSSIFRLDNNDLSGCYPDELSSLCGTSFTCINNPLLPWQGDFQLFCDGQDQIGAICDDENPDTVNDVINADCSCGNLIVLTCDRVQDSLALVALYNATDGPNWTNSWDLEQPMDTWFGLAFTPEGCVEEIALGNNNLDGTLPGDLGMLSQIQRIYLFDNSLNGALPPALSNATTLQQLFLYNNAFSGTLPVAWSSMSALEGLSLFDNSLTGSIPEEWGDLAALFELYLNVNAFEGNIPASFVNLENLQILHVDNNEFTTPIPPLPPNLTEFYIQENALVFGDILPEVSSFLTIPEVIYAPQDSIFTDTLITAQAGEDILVDLGVDETISTNIYTWYKDGAFYETNVGDNDLSLPNVQPADAGVYYVEVTNPAAPDLVLISREITIEVIDCSDAGLVIALTDSSQPNCGSDTNGFLEVIAIGGEPPYDYLWSNGATSPLNDNLGAGTYSATVTDVNGCTAELTPFSLSVDPIELTCPDDIMVLIEADENGIFLEIPAPETNDNCPLDSVRYELNGATILPETLGTVGIQFFNVGTTTITYFVPGQDSCMFDVVVDQVQDPCDDFAIFLNNVSSPTCNDGNDGFISIDVMGGDGNYEYQWSNGATTEDLDMLETGLYVLTITDGNACEVSVSFWLQEENELKLDCTGLPFTDYGQTSNSIQAILSGSHPPFTLDYSGPVSGQLTDLPEGEVLVTDLPEGSYTLTLTDALGCTINCSSIIENPCDLPLVCPDDIFILIEADSSGILLDIPGPNVGNCGLGLIQYRLEGATVQTDSPGAVGVQFFNVGVTTVSYFVPGVDTCTFTVEVMNVEDPCDDFAIFLESVQSPLCDGAADGSIQINVTGGDGNYQYSWSNGTTTEDLFDLEEGLYVLTITDGNACEVSTSFYLQDPDELQLNCVAFPVSAPGMADGSFSVSFSGGTAPYTLAYTGPLSGSEVYGQATTVDFISLYPEGDYIVTLTDANGCSTECMFTIAAEVDCNDLMADLNFVNPSCEQANGAILVVPLTGSGNYSYDWSTGATDTDVIGDLLAGTYQVTITDLTTDCTLIIEVDLINMGAPNTTMINDTICEGEGYLFGNTILTTAGTYTQDLTNQFGCDSTVILDLVVGTKPEIEILGDPEYCSDETGVHRFEVDWDQEVLWSIGATSSFVDLFPSNGPLSVTVTDSLGCTAFAEIQLITYPAPNVVISGELEVCGEETTTITASGGVDYAWSTGQQGPTVDLPKGIHAVSVTSAQGCESVEVVEITGFDAPLLPLYDPIISACLGVPPTIDLEVGPFEVIDWYNANFEFIVTTNVFETAGLDTYYFQVRNTNTGCVSAEFAEIIVTQDLEPPVFTNCPEENLEVVWNMAMEDLPPYELPELEATDNCIGVEIFHLIDIPPVDQIADEGISVLCTAIDAAGNETECAFQIDVIKTDDLTFEVDTTDFEIINSSYFVPVMVNNFTNVSGFQFTLVLSDDMGSSIEGVETMEPVLEDNLSYNFENDTTLRVLWTEIPSGQSQTLPDGTTIFVVELKLMGDYGDCSVLSFADEPADKVAIRDDVGVVIPSTIDGVVCIPEAATIAGRIYREDQLGVRNVEVRLQAGEEQLTTMTDSDGQYLFEELPLGIDYTITPFKDDNHRNGLSLVDITRIRDYVLFGDQSAFLQTPYRKISADATNNEFISLTDLTSLVILRVSGPGAELTNNTSWRFVDAEHVFQNQLIPWLGGFPENRNISDLAGDSLSNDFIAMKIGDVNLTASTLLQPVSPFMLSIAEQEATAGQTIRVPVRASDLPRLIGMELELAFDPANLKIKEILPGELPFMDFHINDDALKSGRLPLIWLNTFNEDFGTEEYVLFELELEVKNDILLSEAIQLGQHDLESIGVNISHQAIPLQLVFDESTVTSTHIEPAFAEIQVFGASPNPFADYTQIHFALPAAKTLQLELFDVRGQRILQVQKAWPAGYHSWLLEEQLGDDTGVLIYRIRVDGQVFSGKLIRQ